MPNNDYCRRLEISGFRNLGIDGMTYLTLNRSLSTDKLGGLVILIGQNNSGKSNVLDSVRKSVSGDFADEDRHVTEEYRRPIVEMVIIHGTERMTVPTVSETAISKTKRILKRTAKDQAQQEIDTELDEKCSAFRERYGFNLRPDVLEYSQQSIRNRDLRSSPKMIGKQMRTLISLCGGAGDVEQAYANYSKHRYMDCLRNCEDTLNRNLEGIVRAFNDMYDRVHRRYSFRFVLDPGSIAFEPSRNGMVLDLDRQSTGFRWFFDFFVNCLAGTELEPGDIVVMDEPANSLHVSAQQELRDFLREFAKRRGVTFVMSTHSPFMIDVDHLDEVRLVHRKDDGSAVIYDKFSTVDYENPDQMDALLNGLTVSRHVLANPCDTCVFVEGITDYNYLTAFKILFGYRGLNFFPINGLKRENMTGSDIIEKLRRVCTDPVLLVDGDEAGHMMREAAEGTGLRVVSLKDADPSFRNMEHLFTRQEKESLHLYRKDWNASSTFKQYIEIYKDRLSSGTKENFRKVFSLFV